jgi:2-polyprenyl-3-methyl-5-hydroxy-6-metoxy-1,4-benzoquinol methylase
MSPSLERVYHKHHSERRRGGFAVLEKERGPLFAELIGRGKKVLDLGCRDGVITRYFIAGNEVTGADVDSAILNQARQALGIKTIHFDVQDNWPLEPNSFDAIVAGELLEHVYFPENILEKVISTLKNGGVFVGSVPNAFAMRNRLKYLVASKISTPLEDPMHINHFSWSELEALLKKHFLDVKLYPLGRSYYGLADKLPSLLAYSIAFSAKKA